MPDIYTIHTLIHADIQTDRKLHSVTVTKNKRFSLIDQMVDFDVKNTHTHTCRHTYRQTENFILLLKINCSVSLTKWLTLTLRIPTLIHAYIQSDRKLHSVTKNKRFSLIDEMVDSDVKNTHTYVTPDYIIILNKL